MGIAKRPDRIAHVLMRDERSGVYAADAYARATGRIGVCDATVGPGASNLVPGLVEAYSSAPRTSSCAWTRAPYGTLCAANCVPKESGMRVGIRELREQIKRYVEAARRGEDVIITDHGHAIARLVALQHERPVDRLIEAGLATPPRQPKGDVDWTPVPSDGSVSDLIER